MDDTFQPIGHGKLTGMGDAPVDDVPANPSPLALLTEQGTKGPLHLYTQQRKLINAIIRDEIGANDAERTEATSSMWRIVLAWLESDDKVVVERGMRAYWRIQANRIITMNSVTAAVEAERRAMVELIKAQQAAGPTDVGVQTIADAVAVAKTALESRESGSSAT